MLGRGVRLSLGLPFEGTARIYRAVFAYQGKTIMDKKASMGDFAALLDNQFSTYRKGFNPGDRITATVTAVGRGYATLDVHSKREGLLPVEEVADELGNVNLKPGDRVDVVFAGMDRDAFLFNLARAEKPVSLLGDSLKAAFAGGLPVEGTVEKEVKGGWEVTVAGQRAFCPYSQMERRRVEGAQYVGGKYAFLVTECSEDDRGANVVLSRRALLERQAQAEIEELKASLVEGETVNGRVVKVMDFGAFVDIGGLEGLVPVREISWDKVVDPRAFVKEGENVTVKILSLDWERNRISLSIRECQSKPLKPKTPEEIAAEEEAVNVREWMDGHRGTSDGFSSLGAAFDGLDLKK